MKELNPAKIEKDLRHQENLRLFTGWKGGRWVERGIVSPGKQIKEVEDGKRTILIHATRGDIR